MATDRLRIYRLIGMGVYGVYFIKLDRRFATWGVDDGRGFDVASSGNLRGLLRFGNQSYRTHFGEGGKGMEGRTEMNSSVLKYAAVLVSSVAFFVAGYQYAAALYTKDIEEMRRDYAERSQAMEEKYRATERKQTQALVAAWQERDAALSRISVLTGDVERVRREADSARCRLSANSAVACKSEREQLARCAGLLERGTELVRRGVELSERTAIDKDAVVKIVNQ